MKEAVKNSKCYTELIKKLGLPPRGNNWKSVKNHIKRLNLNVDHFEGSKIAIKALTKNKKSNKEIFYINSKIPQRTLRRRYKNHVSSIYKCAICNINARYNGKPLILQLDHINGNNKDNRLENLRWLCPNCHSQTETYSRKKKEKI